MKIDSTILPGAYLITPDIRGDERGEFFRVFCKRELSVIGHSAEFVQFNHSVNRVKGLVRGMHFQKAPHREIKLVRCVRGAVYDVIVDMRSDSPTYLKWMGVELSASNRSVIYIPEGFAHGFQTLEENSELLYHHTAYYEPEFEQGVNYLDPTIHIDWPLAVTMVSERDKNLPFININP